MNKAVQDWLTAELIRGALRLEVAALPKLRHQLEVWVHQGDVQGRYGVENLDGWLLATREASELRAQQRQMGQSLVQLLNDLGHPLPEPVRLSWPAAWAWAASAMKIPVLDMLEGYLYGWVANQLSAAVRLVPLGPTRAQVLQQRLYRWCRSRLCNCGIWILSRCGALGLGLRSPSWPMLSCIRVCFEADGEQVAFGGCRTGWFRQNGFGGGPLS
jgi:urease accessory protein UreF